jgi:hypothetical protein
LHRGRRLLKQSLHAFAVEQGIIRREHTGDSSAQTIDIAEYRKQTRG